MGFYRLTNVPTEKSGLEIRGVVEGEQVRVVCCEKNGEWRKGGCLSMGDTFVGDHMLAKPADLRRMYADDLAAAVRLGRDAGYEQALCEIRKTLGIKS